MNVLLICAFQPRYLDCALEWLLKGRVHERYQIIVWDNGGASEICARHGVNCFSISDVATGAVANVGKALGMHHLIDIVVQRNLGVECYVCMDDDVIVDGAHLDALVAAAQRTDLGMVGAMFHPFNSAVPPNGSLQYLDACPRCGVSGATAGGGTCDVCQGSGRDPKGLCLHVFPREDRLERNLGKVAGTLFAIARESVAKLPWAPYLYPPMYDPKDGSPIVYWAEDGALDVKLTEIGYLNGYIQSPDLIPAIHLPELSKEFAQWKIAANRRGYAEGRMDRHTSNPGGELEA